MGVREGEGGTERLGLNIKNSYMTEEVKAQRGYGIWVGDEVQNRSRGMNTATL